MQIVRTVIMALADPPPTFKRPVTLFTFFLLLCVLSSESCTGIVQLVIDESKKDRSGQITSFIWLSDGLKENEQRGRERAKKLGLSTKQAVT